MRWGVGNVKAKVGGSGGADINLAYGLTPPGDTSKIWVKCEEPLKTDYSYYIPTTEDITDLNVETLDFSNEMTSVNYPCIFHYKGYLYIVGGTASGVIKDTIYRVNLKTKTIELLDTRYPFPISRCKPIVIGDNAYFIGGTANINGSDTNLSTIYKLDIKTLTATLLITSTTTYIASEMYDVFKFDDDHLIWKKSGSTSFILYTISTNTITTAGGKSYNNGVNFGTQNKRGWFSCYGYQYLNSSINVFTLTGKFANEIRQTYSVNGNQYSPRYNQGVFSIGFNMFAIGGVRGSGYPTHPEKTNFNNYDTTSSELDNITFETGTYSGGNINENTGYAFKGNKIIIFTDLFTLTENNLLLEVDGKGNIINGYLGDANKKAQLIELYQYNALTEKWEGINCPNYSE